MNNPDTTKFEQQLEHVFEVLFDELAGDLERVQKGKDTPAEYWKNTEDTAERAQAAILAAHRAAVVEAEQKARAINVRNSLCFEHEHDVRWCDNCAQLQQEGGE